MAIGQPITDWKRLSGRYKRNKSAIVGLVIFSVVFVLALAAPYIAPYGPLEVSEQVLRPPSPLHILGTDHLGRDVYSRVLYGARTSLFVGFVTALLSTLLGVAVGAFSGYYGKWIDFAAMRVADVFLVLPSIFLGILVLSFFGATLWNLILVIALVAWPSTARLTRAQFLALKNYPFVEATKLLGARDNTIMFSEILPNAMSPIIVNGSLQTAYAILAEAALSFLGLGDPSQVSWGQMLHFAQAYVRQAWWDSFFPGLGIFVAVLSLNLIGDGLNDALNPRSEN